MSEGIETNSKYTFWKLLKEYNVVIPIIQRDYAQGRKSDNASIIREELLESIHAALVNGEGLDFDFVYGSVEGDTLLPLDGQQRLTTFYLLHWYIAEKEGRMDDAADILKKFSYQTRISSREFCEMLVTIKYEPQEGVPVSKFIKNENRYFKEWDTDPTISHMLNMLDAIHEKFFNDEDLFDVLTSEEEELLTFSYLRMEHYALTDDLYIKMNARGKALSIFENFKAKFIQHLKEQNLPHEHFEEKIDSGWTDLLWDYRDEDNTIDDQFMNLFCYITEMLLLETSEPREGDSPFRPTKIRALIDYYQDEESVNNLYDYLDLWKSKEEASEFLSSIFTTVQDEDKVRLFDNQTDIFSQIIEGYTVPLQNKLLLFALMKRLVMLGKDAELCQMKDYIRIIRNFILNTRTFVRKKCTFSPDMRYGRHAIPIMQNFIDVLADEEDAYAALRDFDFENINSDVCELEKQKARIVIDRPEKKQMIHNLEDLDLFRGAIFNVIPYVEKTDDEDLATNLDVLSGYNETKLIRALLSIKDYGIKIGSGWFGDRYFYGYVKNWYSLFTYSGGDKYTDMICEFVGQFENTEAAEVDECLDEIIENNLPNIKKNDWRYTIVKYPNTMQMSSRYIDHPYIVMAKQICSNGCCVMRRINGFIMIGYNVIPEYLEVIEELGDQCSKWIWGFGCDDDNQGGISLSCAEGLRVQYNSQGEFSIDNRDEDDEWVNTAIEKFNLIDLEDMDRVEQCVLLCNMLIEECKKSA